MDIRMKSEIPPLKTEEGFYVPLNNPRCEICKHITKTHQFESSSAKPIYFSRPQNLNCASKNVTYFSLVKPVINNTQEVLKKFGVDLIITNVRMETF